MDKVVRRGDMFMADLSPVTGSEQGGLRPVLIIQNDIGNKFSPSVIVAAITSQHQKAKLPTHVEIKKEKYNIIKDSVILLEQERTIDKERLDLDNKIDTLDEKDMNLVNKAHAISTGMVDYINKILRGEVDWDGV